MDAFAIVLALVLIGLNAFFVSAEFSIVKVRPTRIEELLRKQRPGAVTVRKIVANIDAYLSACQLGITVASLALGVVCEPVFETLLAPVFARFGLTDPFWVTGVSVSVGLVILTTLHIVVGEQAPKSFAIVRAETVALAVAVPLRIFHVLFFPFIWLLNTLSLWIVRATGTQRGHGDDLPTEEELKLIVAQARSAGLLSASRSEVLRKAMSLPAKLAKHLMVPRNEVAFLDVNLTLEQNLERARQAVHTRFPLCEQELDDVIGVVDVRDVLFAARQGDVDLRALAEPVVYFPELMSGERLLAEFRDKHLTMAVIVDEYGGASGIVTPADVITAVMGEFEEHDENDVVKLPGGAYDVDGTATLEEVEEALKMKIETEDMRTVAGFLMERLGRMPRAGDRVAEGAFVFHVVDVNGPRIHRVRIERERARGSGGPPAPVRPAPQG
jgi:CBS domain containing-hemolysin-like protein